MISLYSVYHGSTLSEQKVEINSNDRVLEKIRAWERQAAEEKLRKNRAAAEKYLSTLPKDDSGNPVIPQNSDQTYAIPAGDDGEPLFSVDENGHPYFPEPEEEEEEEENTSVQTEEERAQIISQAEEEAQSIVEKAKQEADGLFLHTRDEAVQKGYTEGLAKASSENEAKQNELDQRAEALEANYRQKEASMEKEVLDAVLSVVSKAFSIQFGDDSELLLHLIDDCVSHTEGAKELLIRVNEKNYALLTSKRDEIKDKVGEGVSVEFAKDPLLSDGAGLIETDGGVYDVSIDTELKNLIKRIRLLIL